MNNTQQYRKFQFFYPEGEKSDRTSLQNTKVFYSLNDVSINQMRTMDNFVLGSGIVENIPSGVADTSSLNKSLLFKIFNSQILDEYEIHNKMLESFQVKSYQAKTFLFSFGLDLVNLSKTGGEDYISTSNFKIFNITPILNIETDFKPFNIKELCVMYKKENESIVSGNLSSIGDYTPITNVTCLDVSNDLIYCAMGTEEGLVVLFTGKPNLLENIKATVVKKVSNDSITNIAIVREKNTFLFITTTKGIFVYNLETKNPEPMFIKSDGGVDFKCMYGKVNSVVVSLYNTGRVCEITKKGDGKWEMNSGMFFEGVVKRICCFKGYIAMFTVLNGANYFSIFDPVNNIFIQYMSLLENIDFMFTDQETIFIYTMNETLKANKVIRYLEVENKKKFDIFYQKNFYDTAYEFAKNLHYPEAKLAEINKTYAEILFDKKDYARSIEQYIKTISYLEPSYVIQQFLDGSRLDFLIKYLEALRVNEKFIRISTEEEMKDYTALLLNCYIKQRKTKEFEKFVEQSNEKVIETAIEVAKEQQQLELALNIAEKSKNTDFLIQIYLEIQCDYDKAISELEKEENKEKHFNLICKYGSVFLDKRAELTIGILKKIVQQLIAMKVNDPTKVDEVTKKYEKLIVSVFSNQEGKENLKRFLLYIKEVDHFYPPLIIHRLIEVHLDNLKYIQLGTEIVESVGDDKKQIKVITKEECTKAILDLIVENQTIIDKNFVLVLFKINKFIDGIIKLSELLGMQQELISLYMEEDSTIPPKESMEKIIEICDKYSNKDSRYWLQALYFCLSKQEILCVDDKDGKNYLYIVLNKVDENGLLTPKILMQVLDKAKKIPLQMIRKFLVNYLKGNKSLIDKGKNETKKNTDKIRELDKELRELTQQAKQYNAVKCTICQERMNLPFIYFKCGHAYHHSCISGQGNGYKCVHCTQKKNELIMKIKESQQVIENENNTQIYLERLKTNANKFSVVAEYLGKGIFDMNRLIKEENGNKTE